jgi:hypothetical protein
MKPSVQLALMSQVYSCQNLKVAVDTSKKCKVTIQGEGSPAAESNGDGEE